MTEFDRKVEEASARFNRSMTNIAQMLEKETAELVTYSERRGRSGRANAFVENAAQSGGKALRVCGVSRESRTRILEPHGLQHIHFRLMLCLLGTRFARGCAHKQTAGRSSRRPRLCLRKNLRHPQMSRSNGEHDGTLEFPRRQGLSLNRRESQVGMALPITIGAARTARSMT